MIDDGWKTVDTAPRGKWIRTKREGESSENVCLYRSTQIFGAANIPVMDCDPEWVERETGMTTITHSTFLPPTHWRPIDNYCCGLVFDRDGHTLLMRKPFPDWCAGWLNGPGGRVSEGEHPSVAMNRTFSEDIGLDIKDWSELATLDGASGIVVTYFTARHEFSLLPKSQKDGVLLTVRSSCRVTEDPTLSPILRWLIPLTRSNSGVITPIRFRVRG